MAFTKINAAGIGSTETVTLDGLTVINDGSFGGNVSVGGTLTYEDVTNIDSVGLITARAGVVVGSGITLSKDGDVFFTGIATGNGSGLTALNASNIGSGTVPTARLGSGTASSSTFLRGDSTFAAVTSTTINNNADNRIITGSGTANTLEGEANLTFDGTKLTVTSSSKDLLYLNSTHSNGLQVPFQASGTTFAYIGSAISLFSTGTSTDLGFRAESGKNFLFGIGGNEKLRIDSSGRLLIGTSTEGADSGDDLTISNSGNMGLTLRSTDSNYCNIYFSDATSGTAEYAGYVSYQHSTDSLQFATASTERLRITSVGGLEHNGGSSSHYVLTNAGKAINHIHVDGPTGNSGEMGGAISFDCGGTGCAAIAGLQQSSDNDKIGLAFIVHQSSNSADDAIEAMRIDNDGQVAIGAGGASSPLHVKGITGTLGVQAYPQLTLQTAATNGAADTGAGIMFLGHDGSGGAFHGTIRGLKENGTGGNRNSYMSFGTRTNGQDIAERMRISSSSVGQVFLGCTSEPNNGASGIMLQGNGFQVIAYAGSGSGNFIEFNNSNGNIGKINGNASTTSYITSSDYRLKENETAISDGITRLKTLKPYRFNFKTEPSVTQDGFFAHEVSSAVPIAVLGDKDATKEDGSIDPQGIDHSKLVPLLTAALQEAITKIETLETKVAALEG